MSGYLLDTQVIMWLANGSPLSDKANALIDSGAPLFFSVASLWEMTIKNAIGRADFQVDVVSFRSDAIGAGYLELNIEAGHSIAVGSLPKIHRDPFDRMLVAQATVERMGLLTADSEVVRYGDPVIDIN